MSSASVLEEASRVLSSKLSGLLKLFVVVLIMGVLRTFLSVIGRASLVVAAPVALADDPW